MTIQIENTQLIIDSNIIYKFLKKSNKRISVFEGGTGSGKTQNILTWYILELLLRESNEIFTICRKTRPSLTGTVFRDFIIILERLKYFNNLYLNKTEMTYKLSTNLVEFISLDEPQKIRGRKRKYLFLNEANECDIESFRQLVMRTSGKIVLDYNPSDEEHWIYNQVIPRQDCDFLRTTYKDNPFLEQAIIDEIERYKEIDENFWRIYGLGLRGSRKGKIYSNWDIVEKVPEQYDNLIYGLDFGFNNPSALVAVYEKDLEFYLDEILYQTKLTNSELIEECKIKIPNKDCPIYADPAEPDRILEFSYAGFNMMLDKNNKTIVDKNVLAGIDYCKRVKLHITSSSVNLIKEIKGYKWAEDKKTGKFLDVPVKILDHCLDSFRYSIFSHYKNIFNHDLKEDLADSNKSSDREFILDDKDNILEEEF
jgi:phage terminase large subunit